MFEELIKKEDRQELLKEHSILDDLIKIYREQEKEAQVTLRLAIERLNSIQEAIEETEDKFESNCEKLQNIALT